MDNFILPLDRLLGAVILDNFVFYSDRATDRLLASAFDRLEDDLTRKQAIGLNDVLVTPIEGERPNRTDSGNVFCRKARLTAQIAEDRIKDPRDALEYAAAGHPIIFLDDFLGTGEQFVKTWHRAYRDQRPLGQAPWPTSFAECYASKPFQVVVLALVATGTAVQRIQREIPDVTLAITHELDGTYAAQVLQVPPLIPPIPNFHVALDDFLARQSLRLKLPNFMMAHDFPRYGFGSMGLMFSFEHCTPDSSLPILWAEGDGDWNLLVRPR